MSGHAYSHPHFIPRHLFLAWLVLLLALVRSLRLEGGSAAGLTERSDTG
jgi:hypothetical protein